MDAGTYLTEPLNLWTSRAPTRFRDHVPLIHIVHGRPISMSGAPAATSDSADTGKASRRSPLSLPLTAHPGFKNPHNPRRSPDVIHESRFTLWRGCAHDF